MSESAEGIFSPTTQPSISALGEVCLDCGLCCRGAFFSNLTVLDHELETVSKLGMPIHVKSDSKKRFGGSMPCACHKDNKCSIYANRPNTCSGYRCNLLLKTINASSPLADTQEIIRKTNAQFVNLEARAREIGYGSPLDSSLRAFLVDFGKTMEERAKFATLSERDYKFAFDAFQYLQSIDRYFEETSQVTRFSDVLLAATNPKHDLTSIKGKDCVLTLTDIKIKIRFRDCGDLMSVFQECLRGWVTNVSAFGKGDEVDWAIWKTSQGYHFTSRFGSDFHSGDEPYTLVETVDEMIYQLADETMKTDKKSFYIHTAAIDTGDGVILLLGGNEAGKTVLSMAMAQRKRKLLCDDRAMLHFDSGEVSALGYLPMYRFSDAPTKKVLEIDQFVKSMKGPCTDNYSYVKLPDEQLSRFGEKRLVKSIVVLARSNDEVACSLKPAGKREALDVLIDRQYSQNRNQAKVFSTLEKIVSQANCFRLEYHELDAACDALDSIT